MIIALPFMVAAKALFSGLGASALGFLAPIGALFKSAKATLIFILVAAVLIGGGYLYNKRMNRVEKAAETVVQLATQETQKTAENIKTLQMSHEIDTRAIDRNDAAKVDLTTKAEVVVTTKKARIAKINQKKEADVAAAPTPEAKAQVERTAADEVSHVQISSMWKSYCNALASGSPPDSRCSAYI